MARRSGLGKGLEALIPTDGAPLSAPIDGEGLAEIALSQIVANRHQPRDRFDEETLASLTDSIRSLGVLQPILVRRSESGYELIAGERRWRAAKRAGLASIPAIVKETTDVLSLEQALVENLHRQDLNPLEEAAGYQQLIEEFELTQEQLSSRVGKSRSSIANLLRLFQLTPTVQKMVRDDRLSLGHAKVLLGTPDRAFQEHLAKRVASEGLSVRELEECLKERADLEDALDGTPPTRPEKPPRQAGLVELERLLSDHLDTRVKVQMGQKKGQMTIDFANLEDLERLYRVISR